jgi:hypothetical protein
MKKKKVKASPRRQPKKKAIKNPASPWHKFRAKTTTPAPVNERQGEIVLGDEIEIRHNREVDELAAEIEQSEMDRDAEPEEEGDE